MSNYDTFWNDSNSDGLRLILDFVKDIVGQSKKAEEDEAAQKKPKNKTTDGTFDVITALGLNPEDYDYSDANADGVVAWIGDRDEVIVVTKNAYDKNNHMPELIYKQGQAYDNFKGTCGLCSTANAVRILRMGNPTEADAVDFASENGYCEAKNNDDPDQKYLNGGTTSEDRIKVAEHFGLYAEASSEMDPYMWLTLLIAGGAVTFTVYADYLSRDVPEKMGRKVTSNHCITLLGLRCVLGEREDDIRIKEVIVLDTGGWINNKYGVGSIPIEKFERMQKVTQYASFNFNISPDILNELMQEVSP